MKAKIFDSIIEILEGEKELILLIGAGCSTNVPSCIPTGNTLKETIINYICPDEEVEKIRLLNIRFESLLEIYQFCIDKRLEVYNFFEEIKSPNIQHYYIADIIRKDNYVMTTNFDFLIEYALLNLNIPKEEICPVISKKDFQIYKNPDDFDKKKHKFVFKLHGSTKNIITGEPTKDSLITTISAFGKNKEGKSIFQIEPFKIDLVKNITKYRNLVILGYSGSDVFDIIPTLESLSDIKSIIWINHINTENHYNAIEIDKDSELNNNNAEEIYEILRNIKQSTKVDKIYLLNTNTNNLIRKIIKITPDININSRKIDFKDWMERNIKPPNFLSKLYIAHKIYFDFNLFSDAFRIGNEILNNLINSDDLDLKRTIHNNFGIIYEKQSDYEKSLEEYRIALSIAKQIGNNKAVCTYLGNIGGLYAEIGNFENALPIYNEALELSEKIGDREDKAFILNNIGLLYRRQKEYKLALVYFHDSLRIQEELGAPYERITLMINIGGTYMYLKKFNECEKFLEEALKLSNELNKPYKKARVLNSLGLTYLEVGKNKKALRYLREALRLSFQLDSKELKFNIFRNIGGLYHKIGKKEKAIKYFGYSLDIMYDIGLKNTPEAQRLEEIIKLVDKEIESS